jgi:hypothetical protein
MIYGPFLGPFVVALLLDSGIPLLTDPQGSPGRILLGTLMLFPVAALPGVGLLWLSRRRADRAWAPAMAARLRSPFTPGPPDLVLRQAPGRLGTALAVAWPVTVGFVVLALAVAPAWWLAAAGCLAVIARLTWRLRTRPVLTLSTDGFEVASGRRRVALAWAECAAFTATPKGEVQVTMVVDLGLKPPPEHAIRTGLDHRTADDLAALLSSYLPGA